MAGCSAWKSASKKLLKWPVLGDRWEDGGAMVDLIDTIHIPVWIFLFGIH